MNWWPTVTDRHPKIVLPPEELTRELRRRSRRGFLVGGLAAIGAVGAYDWVTGSRQENNLPWPQRRVLSVNEKLAHGYLNDRHLMPSYRQDQVTYLKPNGDVGLGSAVDPSKWRLHVSTAGAPAFSLRLSDITALPRIEMTTRFFCIEGWSVVTSWAGARFSDFTRKFLPPGRDLPRYVSMTTPDEDYFVGLDMKSALHPQTLLAYEHNGQPLTADHGAPLRLVIPVKYGIKNIKRIGAIQFTDQRPDDYWAEEGYDWFAGL